MTLTQGQGEKQLTMSNVTLGHQIVNNCPREMGLTPTDSLHSCAFGKAAFRIDLRPILFELQAFEVEK